MKFYAQQRFWNSRSPTSEVFFFAEASLGSLPHFCAVLTTLLSLDLLLSTTSIVRLSDGELVLDCVQSEQG